MEMSPLWMAAKMLGLESSTDLPYDLKEMINEAERLCNVLDGSIRSRQAIAAIIVAWQASHTNRFGPKERPDGV